MIDDDKITRPTNEPITDLCCVHIYAFSFRHQQPSRERKYNQEFPDEDRYSNSKDEDEVELDEFGRQLAPPNIMSRKAAATVPDEWPPRFETHGSSYVFDTRCAMFYQSDCGFFYDPKTKLYYGNKQGAYFRYDESKQPPFEKVQGAVLAQPEESLNQLDPMLSNKSTDRSKKDAGKKMISIKIKSKTLASAKPKKREKVVADVKQAPVPPAAGSSQVQKKHGADMDKWSERQVEKKDEEFKQQEKPKDQVKVVKTIKGEPICLLCKRKFPTIEKLNYHEKASALHQENVAKQSSIIKTESSDPSRTDYVDRAQQRRNMHGTESSITAPPLKVPAALPQTNPAGPPPTNHPSENLGQTNIGNQMLKKLGWKSGDSLGRQGGDANQNQVQNAIVKDWEKIEALASKGGKGQHPGGSGRHR
jgi:RNA-binding protein 5/10